MAVSVERVQVIPYYEKMHRVKEVGSFSVLLLKGSDLPDRILVNLSMVVLSGCTARFRKSSVRARHYWAGFLVGVNQISASEMSYQESEHSF